MKKGAGKRKYHVEKSMKKRSQSRGQDRGNVKTGGHSTGHVELSCRVNE